MSERARPGFNATSAYCTGFSSAHVPIREFFVLAGFFSGFFEINQKSADNAPGCAFNLSIINFIHTRCIKFSAWPRPIEVIGCAHLFY